MFSPASEPQSIGGVLDTGFKLFRVGFKQLMPIAYLGSIVGALWGWFIESAVLRGTAGALPGGFSLLGTFILGGVVIMIFVSVFMAATLIRARNIYRGEDGSFGSALSSGLRRAPAVFAASLLYGLAVTVGLVALIIPGIWISISLVMCVYAASVDNHGPVKALGYSYELVKGYWWRTAAVFAVIMIIAMVFYFAIGFISAMVLVTGDPSAIDGPSLWLDIIIFPIISAALTALMYCLAYVVYEDLKLRKEGGDLADRIEGLSDA
jgi:hypothetical protein